MEEKNIVSIDLGTSKLACSVASKNFDGLMELLCYDEFPSKGINHGKVSNVNKLSESLKIVIKDIERSLKASISKVVVNAQKYDIKEIDVVAELEFDTNVTINQEHIDLLKDTAVSNCKTKLEGNEEILAMIEQNYNTDDEKNISAEDIAGMMAHKLNCNYKAYVCRSNGARNMEAAFREAGIAVTNNSFCPDTIGESVLTKSELEGGAALIDFGAGACSVSIFHKGTLRHYWALPFGGNSITDDIKNVFSISERLAENIKMQYGCCMPERLESLGEKTLRITDPTDGSRKEFTAKDLSEVVTARCHEIIEALLYDIQQSGYADKLKFGIVLCGGGSKLMNIGAMISDMSGYRTRIATPSKALFLSQENFYTPEAATSAGMLRYMAKDETYSCAELDQNVLEIIPTAEVSDDNKKVNTNDAKENKTEEGGLFGGIFGGNRKKEKKEKKPVVKPEKKEETDAGFIDKLFFSEDDPDNNV